MNKLSTKPITLFIAATHGDEPIGVALLDELSKKTGDQISYESLIANPVALEQDKRYTETDLNRVAPGDIKSSIYEIKRAAEIIGQFEKYKYVIDIHQTKVNDRIIIIIPKLTRESLALALAFDINEIIIWPSAKKKESSKPLVYFAPYGIEIECGTKNSFKKTLQALERITVNFLRNGHLNIEKNFASLQTEMERKNFYLVYNRISKNEVKGINLQDFEEVNTGKEKFTPLLFGAHQGLIGYKMKKLNLQEVLKYKYIK